MAEQFALHQLLRQRRTVDRHKRPVRSETVFLDRPSHQLFASAAVTLNQHGLVRGCNSFDQPKHLSHRFRLTNHPGARLLPTNHCFQLTILLTQLSAFPRHPTALFQVVEREGFGEIVTGPQFHGLDR